MVVEETFYHLFGIETIRIFRKEVFHFFVQEENKVSYVGRITKDDENFLFGRDQIYRLETSENFEVNSALYSSEAEIAEQIPENERGIVIVVGV